MPTFHSSIHYFAARSFSSSFHFRQPHFRRQDVAQRAIAGAGAGHNITAGAHLFTPRKAVSRQKSIEGY